MTAPIKVFVDDRRLMSHGGIARIYGESLKIQGRRQADLSADVRRLLKRNDNKRQRFHMFKMPLEDYVPWQSSVKELVKKEKAGTRDQKYFRSGYLVGSGQPEITLPVRPGELYRAHYSGRDNGLTREGITLVSRHCSYTTGEGFNSEKARNAAIHLTLQEILYIAFIHIGTNVENFPNGIGKNFGMVIDEIRANGEIVDTIIGFMFGQGKKDILHTNEWGMPVQSSYREIEKVRGTITDYLSK